MPKQRYEEVADDLREKITSGEYPRGALLPSRRELGVAYQSSDTVIDKAMMILRLEHRTETLQGVGVYVSVDQPEDRKPSSR